jgi:hypothetical protein
MTKKIVLLAAAFYSFAAAAALAAPDCVLSNSDVQALALSPSHFTAEQFASASADEQKRVCRTRAAVKQFDADGGVLKPETVKVTMAYSTKYLSPAENDKIVDASNVWLETTLKEKGYGN